MKGPSRLHFAPVEASTTIRRKRCSSFSFSSVVGHLKTFHEPFSRLILIEYYSYTTNTIQDKPSYTWIILDSWIQPYQCLLEAIQKTADNTVPGGYSDAVFDCLMNLTCTSPSGIASLFLFWESLQAAASGKDLEAKLLLRNPKEGNTKKFFLD